MKNLILSLLSITFLLASCSKEEQAPPPLPTPTYTLSFSAEAGGSVSSEGGTYNQGSKITVTATPDAQYLFKEWSDGSTTNPREITVTSNLTLKASFIKKTYPLAVTIEGEGTVQEEVIIQGSTSETTYNAGTTVRLTATPNEGWVFAGWSGDVESEELEIEVPIEKGTSVSALFKRDSFELNITIEGEGTVKEEVIVQPGQYDYETVVRLTAIPSEGQKFNGWSGYVISEENPIEVELKEKIELTVSFERIDLFTYKDFYIDFIRITQPSVLGFNEDTRNHSTDFYSITKKGWLGITVEEYHNGGIYGTGNINPGYFWITPSLLLKTDLNNDGLEDMIINTGHGPHTVSSSQGGIPFFALVNLGDGTFEYSQEFFESSFTRDLIGSYKSEVADFNGDGVVDFILGTQAGPVVNEDGSVDGAPGNPILALSNGIGSYRDGSQNLNGIVSGTILAEDDLDNNNKVDYLSNGAQAVGDFDNDGDVDYFLSRKIFLNDGTGVFNISTSQLNESLIPEFLGRSLNINTNTYSTYSDDFNNDGFDDIVLAPTSEYIIEQGGSGWIAMSNGSADFANWTKVPLPDPAYPNNSNLNEIESLDFDNDGFTDLIIANTRRTPYYRGIKVQLLKNNGGNGFSDVTESNIEDQSDFDLWRGEGRLYVEDLNNDGQLDFYHLTTNTSDGPPNQHHGTNIYLNNNGFFEIYDTENKIPFINWTQFDGWESFIDDPNLNDKFTLDRAFPINIDGDGVIDFISTDLEMGSNENPKPMTLVFYSIISK